MASVFRTPSILLAAWIIAERSLPYLRVEPGKNAHQRLFVFEDPDGAGPELERLYIAGNPMCNAKALNDSVRMLRYQVPTAEVRDATH